VNSRPPETAPLTEVFIGLDVGGTKIAGGLALLPGGQVGQRLVAPTRPERGGAAVLGAALDLVAALAQAAAELGRPVAGIGIGLPELVDLAGRMTSTATLQWDSAAAQAAFEQVAPAVFEADVRAAALAEAALGAGQNQDNFVYVSVGTGISICHVLQGQPYAGARGNALVLGSMPLPNPGGRGAAVTLEQWSSGPALAARYQELSGRPVSGAEPVLAAAAAGDPAAVKVARSGGHVLGAAVGWLINVLDPGGLIVGGGLGSAAGVYWDSFLASVREHVYAPDTRELAVCQAALGPDAGWIGAAVQAWRRQRSPEAKPARGDRPPPTNPTHRNGAPSQ
jgi:glucokinase